MSVDIDVATETTDTDSVQSQANAAPAVEPLSADLSDPLAEGGETSGGDAVQMILPPKPGQGPRVEDPVASVDSLAALLDDSREDSLKDPLAESDGDVQLQLLKDSDSSNVN